MQWYVVDSIPDYSGATATDFHRLPFSPAQHVLLPADT
jgi:hypothetical protein